MDERNINGLRRVISVTGTGRATRRPDRATLSLSAEVTAASAGDAQRLASEAMQAILAALASRVDTADVSTQGIGLEPVYDYRETGAKLTGYRANQTLAVRVRTLDELGPIIDAAVGAGATGIADVSLDLADPAEAEAEARRGAVADARTQAEDLAAAAGVTLGPLLKLEAVGASPPPRPMMRMAAEAATTPIAEGSTEVVVVVLATYAIGG